MTHLTPDEVVDAVERTLDRDRRAHLAGCAGCTEQVAALSRLLSTARAVDVPEPSPIFWERFSDRVRAAIAAEPNLPRRQRWFAWPVLAPVAALALLVVALAGAIARHSAAPAAGEITADSGVEREPQADLAAVEAVWALAADLVGTLDDVESQDAALIVSPGSAERAAGQLSSDEQAELVRLLQQELGRSGG